MTPTASHPAGNTVSISSGPTTVVSPKLTLGIDPGKGGGIAWRINDETHAAPMPKTEGDIRDLLHGLMLVTTDIDAALEEVPRYIPGQATGSSIAKLHENFGFLKGFLIARSVRMRTVIPQTWQKRLGVGTKSGKTTSIWKNILKNEAQRRFPHLKVTLKNADALLILDWAMANP